MIFTLGWGRTVLHGTMSHILQQAAMKVIDSKKCNHKKNKNLGLPIKPSMICGSGAGRINGCLGDSGGPLSCYINGRWELHGVVSHGSGTCDSSRRYTVFARIFKAISWIKKQTGV